jgi:hypothetical protein
MTATSSGMVPPGVGDGRLPSSHIEQTGLTTVARRSRNFTATTAKLAKNNAKDIAALTHRTDLIGH